MVQKLIPVDAKIVNESIQNNWRWRRISAFLLTSLSLFLLLTFIWGAKVRAYRSDNSLSFRLNGSEQQQDSLNAEIFEAMKQSTSDEALISLVKTMKDQGQVSSSVLMNSDLDSLRDRIKVYTRVIKPKNVTEARFSFVGSGTPDETRFLNRLTENIYSTLNSNISYGSESDIEAVDAALSHVSQRLKSHLENQNNFNNSFYTSVAELDQQLGRIRIQLAELDSIATSNFAPGSILDEQTRAPISEGDLQKLIKQHEQNQYQHQNSSKELSAVEKQIAVLRTKTALVSMQNREQEFESNQYFDKSQNGSPKFDSVSFPKEPNQPNSAELFSKLSLLNQEFQSLNTTGLHSVFDSIQDRRTSDLSGPIEYIENFKTSLSDRVQNVSAVSLVEPGTTKVVPVGGLPTNSQVFWITFISLAFGVAIAWRLNPADSDRGFQDSSGLSEVLGVPVVGSFPLKSAKITGVPIATRIVSLCKIGLPILLLIIVACCLLNKSVWAQMAENPIHGLVRVVWMFKGH